MLFWKNSQERRDLSAEYATRRDFQKIFTEDMADLHLLAFLLTADQDKAEECFVSGLDDSVAGNPVFREWARSWSKRAIIKNAIRLISPESTSASGGSNKTLLDRGETAAGNRLSPAAESEVSAILDLDPFDRFAFVMSVLEGFSDRDCALLLGCTQQALVAGRLRALQRLSHAIVNTEGTSDDVEVFVRSA